MHIARDGLRGLLIAFLILHGANIDGRNITGSNTVYRAVKAMGGFVRKFVKTTADLSATDFDGLGAILTQLMAGSVPV